MTEAEVLVVQERVAERLHSSEGRPLDLGNPQHLEALARHVQLKKAETAEDELWITVAMSWLGPDNAGIPPTVMRQQLLEILRRLVVDEENRLKRVMEFAIAYGGGKWREVRPGAGGWEHRWQGAMRGLVRALEPAVEQANRWLAEHVVGFPQGRHVSHTEGFVEDTALWSDAWVLATHLVQPEHHFSLLEDDALTLACLAEGTELLTISQDYDALIPPGAKAVWTVREQSSDLLLPQKEVLPLAPGALVSLLTRDDDVIIKTAREKNSQQGRLKIGEDANLPGPLTLAMWECTCGTTHCLERHRLESWDPIQMVQKTSMEGHKGKMDASLTLWAYVASAVKGPQASLKTGAFVQGIYFPLLTQESFAQ
jgi:uncharacterized cupin superfamily protein